MKVSIRMARVCDKIGCKAHAVKRYIVRKDYNTPLESFLCAKHVAMKKAKKKRKVEK